jgi:hypothetical protein
MYSSKKNKKSLLFDINPLHREKYKFVLYELLIVIRKKNSCNYCSIPIKYVDLYFVDYINPYKSNKFCSQNCIQSKRIICNDLKHYFNLKYNK